MKLRLPVVFVIAVVAVAWTAPVFSRQAAPAIVPKEMAAVQRIRARIEEKSAKAAGAKPAPYKVTLPNTTFEYGMAPIPAGEFLMGATGPGAKPDQQPQHKVRLDA